MGRQWGEIRAEMREIKKRLVMWERDGEMEEIEMLCDACEGRGWVASAGHRCVGRA